MKITRFSIEPFLTHLNASTAPTIRMAQATPPTNTFLFQGERSAKKRQERPHRRKDEEPQEKLGPVEPRPGVVAYWVVFIHYKSGIRSPAVLGRAR